MSPQRVPDEVVVVTGIGDMGSAAARRLAPGRQILIADWSESNLERRAAALRADGHFVHERRVDISDRKQVEDLARLAGELGSLRVLFNTAGVSPAQADARSIFDVDVLGTAYLLDAFEPLVGPGTVGVFIASMAGTMTELPAEALAALASAPTDELAALPVLDPGTDPGAAYGIAKRANQMRIQAASIPWGRRGGRVVSISPGIISTADGREELESASGEVMRQMLAISAAGRIGTPEDIAAVVEFLVGPQASLITGTDILVDGGIIAALRHAGAGVDPAGS